MTENPGLFDMPAPKPLAKPRSPRTGTGPVKYAKYAPVRPVKCDDCMLVAWEAGQEGRSVPLARQARWKRTQGESVALVCAEHKQQRLEDEAVPQRRGKTG
jgi:hypothetical protein